MDQAPAIAPRVQQPSGNSPHAPGPPGPPGPPTATAPQPPNPHAGTKKPNHPHQNRCHPSVEPATQNRCHPSVEPVKPAKPVPSVSPTQRPEPVPPVRWRSETSKSVPPIIQVRAECKLVAKPVPPVSANWWHSGNPNWGHPADDSAKRSRGRIGATRQSTTSVDLSNL
jgi:hypothetical protein